MENKPIRPSCFDFAMDFLGEPQAAEILKYIEALESNAQQNTNLTKAAPDLLHMLTQLVKHQEKIGRTSVLIDRCKDAIAKATGE